VVGVVGAAHVKGIQARWEQAGSDETAKQVAEYCGTDALALPTQAGPWINLAAGTSCHRPEYPVVHKQQQTNKMNKQQKTNIT